MTPDKFSLAIIQAALQGLPISDIRYFESTGSTNDDALRWIAEGAKDGSLVIANEQTSGRGRMDRKWVTRKDTSLAFSLILHPETSSHIPMFAPLGALAVALSLEKLFEACPQIKWPNDVLLDRRKICGILTEASWREENLQGVVMGIGINIASNAVLAADEFIFPASTLQSCLNTPVDRLEILAEVLRQIFLWQERVGSPDFLRIWGDHLAFSGEEVIVHQPGRDPATGIFTGITPEGSLIIRQESGMELVITAGDVSLRTSNPDPGNVPGGSSC
jgi:BirA family biotin operon repressor/biotin-[acetyl-CoA-carboxylase] ligase